MKEQSYREFSDSFYADVKGSSADRVPLEGMIELTRLCSVKCTHCYIGDARWVKDPNELSTREVKDLLDTLAERGTLWLCFTGGEAMIRKDFKEIWVYAKKKGFVLTLFSNATLIDKKMAAFLYDHPPFNLEISIYGGTEEVYERVTQVKGSYRRFLRGVENVRKTGLPWKLKTVLIRENAHEIDLMQSMAESWEVSFKYDSNINPSIGEGKTGGKAPCSTRVEAEVAVTLDLADPVRIQDTHDMIERTAHTIGSSKSLFGCGAGKDSFYINARGNLQMCILTGHRGHSLKGTGSVAAEFDQGWTSFEEAREIKRRADSPCLSCDIANLCEACPGFAFLENGDEHSAVEYLCRNTHLKALGMGIKHRCDITHFVYNSVPKQSAALSSPQGAIHARPSR